LCHFQVFAGINTAGKRPIGVKKRNKVAKSTGVSASEFESVQFFIDSETERWAIGPIEGRLTGIDELCGRDYDFGVFGDKARLKLLEALGGVHQVVSKYEGKTIGGLRGRGYF
jgi:hypothetical protein